MRRTLPLRQEADYVERFFDEPSNGRTDLVQRIRSERRHHHDVVQFFGLVFRKVPDDLLGGNARRLIAAVKSSVTRPMLIIASNEKAEDLDPDFVTLVVRKPYDVLTLTGVLLSAVINTPTGAGGETDSRVAN